MKTQTKKKLVLCAGGLVAMLATWHGLSSSSPAPSSTAPTGRVKRETSAAALPPLAPEAAEVIARMRKDPTVSLPVRGDWAAAHPGVDMNRPDWDQDGDGRSNLEEMLAGTNPIEGDCEKIVPLAYDPALEPSDIHEAPPQELERQAAERYAQEAPVHAERMRAIYEEAELRGIPTQIGNPDREGASVLNGFEADGTPVYLAPASIQLADGIGADNIWPSGLTTGVAGWATGSAGTGYNLTGSGKKVSLWEATGAPDRFNGRFVASGVKRIVQHEEPDQDVVDQVQLDSHATSVASIIGSSGAGTQLPDYTARGIAYEAELRAYISQQLPTTLDDSAGRAFRIGNQSIQAESGFSKADGDNDGNLDWVWHGGAAETENWRLGAYTDEASYGTKALDDKLSVNPYLGAVVAAGNTRLIGPGSATSYYNTGLPGFETTVRDWANGDDKDSSNNANADPGYDSLNPLAASKNALVVGAVEYKADGYAEGSTPTYASYSGAGPADDGRIRPDVVAPATVAVGGNSGTRNPAGIPGPIALALDFEGLAEFPACPGFLKFTNTTLGSDTDPAYERASSITGTSAAAAAVSGSFALCLQQRGKTRPHWDDPTGIYFGQPAGYYYTWNQVRSSQLRALAVHCATDVGSPGPDFKGGYGVVNAQFMAQLMGDNAADQPSDWTRFPYIKQIEIPQTSQTMRNGLPNLSGAFAQFTVRVADTSKPLVATLAWTDVPVAGQTSGTVDQTTKRLKNDLDIRIYKPGTTTFNPNAAGDANVVTTAGVPYKPWTLNPALATESGATRSANAVRNADDALNTVEKVVATPSAGVPLQSGVDYIVRVTPKNTNPTQPWQWCTVVLSNVLPPPAPNPNVTIVAGTTPGTYDISWQQATGGVYQVERSTNLVTWTAATGPMSARTLNATMTFTGQGSSTFWRVRRHS